MSDIPARPPQTPSEISVAFWEGANKGRLLLQRCAACGTLRHYPRLLCSTCYSEAVEWQEASGRGRIHSWTVAHHPFHPSFRDEVPYTLVTIDLEEGPRALGRWAGGELTIGSLVQGRFVAREGGMDLVFEPA